MTSCFPTSNQSHSWHTAVWSRKRLVKTFVFPSPASGKGELLHLSNLRSSTARRDLIRFHFFPHANISTNVIKPSCHTDAAALDLSPQLNPAELLFFCVTRSAPSFPQIHPQPRWRSDCAGSGAVTRQLLQKWHKNWRYTTETMRPS